MAQSWAELPSLLVTALLYFCRIGTCLSLMPGFGSARIPAQIRLFIAFGATLALASALGALGQQEAAALPLMQLVSLTLSEAAIGAAIGLMGRSFLAALEFLADAASYGIGLSSAGTPIDEDGALPTLVTLSTLSASVLIFALDGHWEILRGLAQSYKVIPFGSAFNTGEQLSELVDTLTKACLLALQICSPFIVYGIFANMVFGLLNKMAPQIPVYFISAPFILAGGILLFYFTAFESLQIFVSGFSAWIEGG